MNLLRGRRHPAKEIKEGNEIRDPLRKRIPHTVTPAKVESLHWVDLL